MDSSDYDFDFDEGELVAVLDKVEKEHEGRTASSTVYTSQSVATSSSRAGVVVQTRAEVEVMVWSNDERRASRHNPLRRLAGARDLSLTPTPVHQRSAAHEALMQDNTR